MFSKKKNTCSQSPPDLKTAEGFEKIYHLYAPDMYRICLAKTGDKELTRDIIQEVFKSFWERRQTLEITDSVEQYLMGALKRRIIDYFRTQAGHQQHEELFLADYCGYDHFTEQAVLFNELLQKVNELVIALPAQCRNVYRLSREQGFSNREIASFLLISERAVAYHLAKANAFLKEELGKHYHFYFPVLLSFLVL